MEQGRKEVKGVRKPIDLMTCGWDEAGVVRSSVDAGE
jgi:hypothetical protein